MHTPVQQQLQYTLCGGKGPVCGEEDAGVGQVIITERCEKCLYQALKCPRPDTPDLTRLQLTHRVTWRQAVALCLREQRKRREKYLERNIKACQFLNTHPSIVQRNRGRKAEINRAKNETLVLQARYNRKLYNLL